MQQGTHVTRRALVVNAAAAAAALSSASFGAGAVGLAHGANETPSLRDRATRKGLLCGSAADFPAIVTDARLQNALKSDCNILVPENGFNWTRLQPAPNGPLDFRQAEAVYAFAQANDQKMRGHNLVWHDHIVPPWARELVESMSPSATADFMTKHVIDVASAWRGRVIHQEVVNEPVSGDGLISTAFSRKLGERYMDLAFDAAKSSDPDALLFINQDWIEMNSREHEKRRNQLLRLLERLLSRGVPVQALGIEGHLQLYIPFSEQRYRAFLNDISGMGLKILITEFDIHDLGQFDSIAQRDANVAALGKAFLDVSFDYRNCLGVLTWGATDNYNWLRLTPGKQRPDKLPLRPTPRDDKYNPKPLWTAIATALDNARKR